ncbi:hypothetical protein Tco_1448456 [Tanacetum coccineum]
MKRVNTFMAMGSEEQESKEKKAEGSEETTKGSRKKMLGRKRAGKQQQQEFSKKQNMEEDKESDVVEEVSEVDEGELLKHLVLKKDEDIAIDAIPLATKLPVIVDYKLYKEGPSMNQYSMLELDLNDLLVSASTSFVSTIVEFVVDEELSQACISQWNPCYRSLHLGRIELRILSTFCIRSLNSD